MGKRAEIRIQWRRKYSEIPDMLLDLDVFVCSSTDPLILVEVLVKVACQSTTVTD